MPPATENTNKEIVRRFHEVVNTGDHQVISRTIREIAWSDVMLWTPLPTPETGVAAVEQVWANLLRVFPDVHVELEDMVAEDDKVVGRSTVTGTHRGEFMGIAATGKRVEYNEMFMFHFVNGRIAQIWGVVDIFSLLRQLGAYPH
ncbi:ester cyclase [Nocardia sp. NPDC058176]|uniref:ester cyclase n=1 Tax=Nocardia sp. NPDC058176 TaxID=3346368 RepID=UPI0036DB9758